MARSAEATPTARVLAWARANSGVSLEVAAKRAGVEPERLEQWERGDANPTIRQLRALAAAYRRPLALFYLPEPPYTFTAMHDYRRLPDTLATATQSPELRLEIRKAWNRRDVALELLKELKEPATEFRAPTLPDDPEAAAVEIRRMLGVTLETQRSWREEYDAWSGWRTSVEQTGALVFQAVDVPIEEARGFSIAEFPLPVVVVNLKDTPRGRVFTLLHELVHLIRRQSGVCDLDERGRPTDTDLRTEMYCNHVAAAVLLPREEFLSEPIVVAHPRSKEIWSADDELIPLVRRWGGASQEAIVRRLVELGRSTQRFYAQRRHELIEVYRQRRADQAAAGGFVPPHRLALASAGAVFTSLILDGYDRKQITASDVADYLEIRLKHLPEVRGDLHRRAG